MSKKKNMQLNSTSEDQLVETESVEEAQNIVVEEPQVDFDAWFAAREAKIPPQHRKEILKADFKARGVPTIATMSAFDEALRKYGVTL
jgi:hypothetical protein